MLRSSFRLVKVVRRFAHWFKVTYEEIFVRSVQSTGYENDVYKKAKADCLRIGATDGIDAALRTYNLDALVVPAEGWASGPAAIAGAASQFVISCL